MSRHLRDTHRALSPKKILTYCRNYETGDTLQRKRMNQVEGSNSGGRFSSRIELASWNIWDFPELLCNQQQSISVISCISNERKQESLRKQPIIWRVGHLLACRKDILYSENLKSLRQLSKSFMYTVICNIKIRRINSGCRSEILL